MMGGAGVSKPTWNPGLRAVLNELLLDLPGVVEGKMFGFPAYYVHGKLFACLYGEGVGLKVPGEIANRLLTERHVVPFQPLGRPPMREWVQINRPQAEDYRQDAALFRASAEFVGTMAGTAGKR